MKLYNANTIGCVNYHMFLHFVMHFHVVLYTFIASIGTWLWWLWDGVIKVLYLKCQPLPIIKRSSLPLSPFFFFFFLILPESSFFNRDVIFCCWGWLRPCVRRNKSLLWDICQSMLKSLFRSYSHFSLPVTSWSSSLGFFSYCWNFGHPPSAGRTAGLLQYYNIGLLRAWARPEFFSWGKFSHVILFFLIFWYGHNGDYISMYLTTSCFFVSFFWLFFPCPESRRSMGAFAKTGPMSRHEHWQCKKSNEINPLHQC